MFTFVDEYLKTYDQFELFGLSHWAAIFLFLLLVFLLPWYAKNHLNKDKQNKVGIALGLIGDTIFFKKRWYGRSTTFTINPDELNFKPRYSQV